ncbi:MAG: PAS domain S-box protein, partial [Dehalococcoidales bacterium]|nr:PAS domain S-box protein [Dehalococcoidales bacterium]
EASGYTEDELLVRDLSTIVHPDDREKVRQNVVQMLKGKRLQPYEFRFVTKSGETGWALERVVSITYAGRPAILGVCINITEHKQAEEALRHSEEKYAALVEKGNDGIIVIQDGVLMFINSKGLEMTGFSMNEVLGRAFLDFVSPESRGLVGDRYSRRIAGEPVSARYEMEILSKDGAKIPVEISASIIEYEGRPADMAIFRDISERKKIEEALKESEELYTTLANSSPSGVYTVQDNKFVFTNPAFQKATEFTEDELLGKDPLSIIHPEDRDSVMESASQMLRGKRLQPYEFRFVTKSGGIRWALERVAPVMHRGRRVTLGNTINITEHKQAEQLYHTLADSSPVGVYILQDGKFVFTNPAFQEATGFTDDDLLGRDAPWIVHPEDRQRVMKNAIEMVKGKRFQPYEFRFITKSGETKWALERTASITYQGRRASLANFLDVTESKQAQERIERAAEEWRTTFDSITDFISIHDKDNRLVRMNKALADAFKTTPKELIGKVCHEVMHGT